MMILSFFRVLALVGAVSFLAGSFAQPDVSVDLVEPFSLNIIANGEVSDDFTTLGEGSSIGPELLGIRDFSAVFVVSAALSETPYSFSLQKVPSTFSTEIIDFPRVGNISTLPQNLSIAVECVETGAVTYQVFLALAGASGPEIVTFQFAKQCKAPGVYSFPHDLLFSSSSMGLWSWTMVDGFLTLRIQDVLRAVICMERVRKLLEYAIATRIITGMTVASVRDFT